MLFTSVTIVCVRARERKIDRENIGVSFDRGYAVDQALKTIDSVYTSPPGKSQFQIGKERTVHRYELMMDPLALIVLV